MHFDHERIPGRVVHARGSADTARDVRGFAVKFCTDEGNWDLVGNNIAAAALATFKAALARHKVHARETNPPRV